MIVEDALSKGSVIDEMLDLPIWVDIIESVKETFDAVAGNKPVPVQKILQSAGKLLIKAKRYSIVAGIPSFIAASELRPYTHAVNIAIISLQMGKQLGYNDFELLDLVIGCFLHDIGKVKAKRNELHQEIGTGNH